MLQLSGSVKLYFYTSRVARSVGKIRENIFFQGQDKSGNSIGQGKISFVKKVSEKSGHFEIDMTITHSLCNDPNWMV